MHEAAQSAEHEAIAELRGIAVRGLVFAAFLSFFVSLLYLAVPLYMLQVYDRVLGSRSLDTLTVLAVITLAAIALYGLLEYLRGRTYHVLANNIASKLSMPAIRNAVRGAALGGGASVTQALRDLMDVRSFVSGASLGVLGDILWSPMFLIILWMFHPMYVLIGLGGVVLLVTVSFVGSLVTKPTLLAAAASTGEIYREVGQSASRSEAIEAMGMVVPLSRRWCDAHGQLTANYDRADQLGKAFSSASRTLRLVVQVLVLTAGAYLVIHREVSPGTIIASSIITNRLLQPFEQMVESWRQLIFARNAFRRLLELMSTAAGAKRNMVLPRPSGRVASEKLTYFPPGAREPVLRDVSFQVEPGEILGIIGPSGAGKSMLARAIVGVVQPTVGGIYLDGHSTFTWERSSFGRHVGYLPQDLALLDGSIRDNIARMSDADPKVVVEAARVAGIHDVIGRLENGYETRIGPTGFQLSGGQLQRIALARALFDSPALLVLDEPNSSLDNEGEIALDRMMRRAKAAGTTVIIIAHRPAAVAQADKLLVLMNGRVDQFGSKTDVLRTGKALPIGVKGVPAIRSTPPSQGSGVADDEPASSSTAETD